jgi:AraC-like DNA-binding protein
MQTSSPAILKTVEVSGIEMLRERLPSSNLDNVQLETGAFSGRFAFVDTQAGAFGGGRFSKAVRSRGDTPTDTIILGTILRQSLATCYWGQPVQCGDLVVIRSRNGEYDFHSTSAIEYSWTSLKLSELEAMLSVVDPEASEKIASTGMLTQDLITRGNICRFFKSMMETVLAGKADELNSAHLARNVFMDCVSLINHATAASTHPHLAHDSALVRRAETLAGDPDGNIDCVIDLCMALNVSRRTLERTFHRIVGKAPKAYLRHLKLCMAREELARGDRSVTEVAIKHGFLELGRFAQSYRRLFGELPSETAAIRRRYYLSRARGDAHSMALLP